MLYEGSHCCWLGCDVVSSFFSAPALSEIQADWLATGTINELSIPGVRDVS